MGDTKPERLRLDLRSIERKQIRPSYAEEYSATFRVSGDLWHFDIPIWITEAECENNDLIRHAKHRLHLLFEELAKQTQRYRVEQTSEEPTAPPSQQPSSAQ
ncbi:hypothetical protein D8770_26130 [Methylobacterium sp. DB1607]|nr:hypothetical protein [Methylobacterium sp. DB1607]